MELAVGKEEGELVSMDGLTAGGSWVLGEGLLEEFKGGYAGAGHTQHAEPDGAVEVASANLVKEGGEYLLYLSKDVFVLILEARQQTPDQSVQTYDYFTP